MPARRPPQWPRGAWGRALRRRRAHGGYILQDTGVCALRTKSTERDLEVRKPEKFHLIWILRDHFTNWRNRTEYFSTGNQQRGSRGMVAWGLANTFMCSLAYEMLRGGVKAGQERETEGSSSIPAQKEAKVSAEKCLNCWNVFFLLLKA